MKKILVSVSIIGIVSLVVIGMTYAYFNDSETSAGNTFSAGEIDLKVDYHCLETGCGWPLKDLVDNDAFFRECDVKPGDSKNSSISWHVYNNNAWGRIRLEVNNWEYGCNEPESKVDTTCGNAGLSEGELGQYLLFDLWMDEGQVPGWQCTNTPHCAADPKEGNSILDAGETVIATDVSANDIAGQGWIVLPQELIASNTYYFGIKWHLPNGTGNIAQTDSLTGKIYMQVVQSRTNPDKIFP